MGRRIMEIDAETFLKIENAEIPYPFPLQQAAWLALLHWQQGKPDAHSIWFLRLPLDLDGLLIQEARDQFLFLLLESLGSKDQASDAQTHNPFVFTPKKERMAMFHAKTLRTLQQPASSFYAHAVDYFSGKLGFDQWAFVGIQGIADLAARLDEGDNSSLLTTAIAELPERPLDAICQCLEGERLPDMLAAAIIKRCQQSLCDEHADPLLVAALVRGAAGCPDQYALVELLRAVLDSHYGRQPEVLASISARCWGALRSEALRRQFIENLAANEGGQEIFNHVCIDCLRIPDIGPLIQQEFRNPKRSEQLSSAIGGLFQSLSTESNA